MNHIKGTERKTERKTTCIIPHASAKFFSAFGKILR